MGQDGVAEGGGPCMYCILSKDAGVLAGEGVGLAAEVVTEVGECCAGPDYPCSQWSSLAPQERGSSRT
jgi:hypothetical protein